MAKVMLTCALTGAGDTPGKSPHVPVTPEEIARDAVAVAQAGATCVHIHVRDPKTGKAGRDLDCYREVVRLIRASGTDILINLTAGMGGQLVLDGEQPLPPGEGTDLVSAEERFAHIVELLPDICTIDCGSMNFGNNALAINRARDLTYMATTAQALGVKPELECFDLGQVAQAIDLVKRGLIDAPPLFQFVLGAATGAPASAESIIAMRHMLPADAIWAAFGISRACFPTVAQAAMLGGSCRVGLEDNLYLSRGELATNRQLAERASTILGLLGYEVMGPQEARSMLGITKRA